MTHSILSANKTVFVPWAIGLLLLSALTARASALTSEAQAALPAIPCNVDQQLKQVNAARQEGQNEQSSLIKELKARKALLGAVNKCTLDELKDLALKISSIEPSTADMKKFEDLISQQIEVAINYHEYQGAQIENLGIQGSKNMARNLKDKRRADQLMKQLGADYVIWSRNQELFETAEKRFAEIKKTVSLFELPEDDAILAKLKESANSLDTASALNNKVWKFLRENDPDSASVTIRDSLEKLSEAYKIFFEISDMAKKILPVPR